MFTSQAHNTVWIGKGKRPEDDLLVHRQDRGSRSESQRQDNDRERGLVWVAYDSPECRSEILVEFDARLTQSVVEAPTFVLAIPSVFPPIDVTKGTGRL